MRKKKRKEKEIYKEQFAGMKKPPQILEKMIEGRGLYPITILE